ncbi:hypothetical protein OH77DRAFT_1430801 [Trametes cingulata]|nr:hypothetical protein OH77DRAFT_1430801 [Trametes cingulata]
MKRLCPGSLQYAVIRIDPVAMVEHLNDPIATAEAQRLCPKKYLVYLDNALDLPFPTSPWFRFQVSPIGTTLRPEEPARGVTSGMCIPIFPNEDHPAHRPSIRTRKPFPFSHCYHWVDNLTTVRIRRIPELYEDAPAIKVGSLQHIRMEKVFAEDCSRINAFVEARQAEEGVPRLTPRPLSRGSQDSRLSDESSAERDLRAPRCSEPTPEDVHLPTGPQINPCLEDLLHMDIFNIAHDPDVQFLPLVDLWFDLAEHLTEDEIPSPLDFYEERKAIARIILDARERSLVAKAPRWNGALGLISDGVSEEDEGLDDVSMQTDDEDDNGGSEEDEADASAEEEAPLEWKDIPRHPFSPHRIPNELSCSPPSERAWSDPGQRARRIVSM